MNGRSSKDTTKSYIDNKTNDIGAVVNKSTGRNVSVIGLTLCTVALAVLGGTVVWLATMDIDITPICLIIFAEFMGFMMSIMSITMVQNQIDKDFEDIKKMNAIINKIKLSISFAVFGLFIALTLLFGILGGCSPMHVEVDPSAKQRVKVLAVESQVGQDCDFLGGMTAAFNAPLVSFEENVKNATNDLINRAAESGATHLLLGDPQVDLKGSFVMDECIHCVVMDAKAFACK